MVFTTLAAVAFINQHNDVRAVVYTLWHFGSGIKLLDEREDNPLSAFANLFSQAFTGGRHGCFFVFLPGQFAARGKGFSQLGFQIYPVSHHYNTALIQAFVQDQRLT